MLRLKIVTPEKIVFKGEVESVVVPGTRSNFEILTDHAPIISSIEKGIVAYGKIGPGKQTLEIKGGFVEVKKNEVNICAEI